MRAARRRRYGWAALRLMRRAIRAALIEHRRRTLDPARAYDGTRELVAIHRAYNRAVRELLARWPRLSLFDERAEPDAAPSENLPVHSTGC